MMKMDVHVEEIGRQDFAASLKKLRALVNNCSFVAIDTEMGGLSLQEYVFGLGGEGGSLRIAPVRFAVRKRIGVCRSLCVCACACSMSTLASRNTNANVAPFVWIALMALLYVHVVVARA